MHEEAYFIMASFFLKLKREREKERDSKRGWKTEGGRQEREGEREEIAIPLFENKFNKSVFLLLNDFYSNGLHEMSFIVFYPKVSFCILEPYVVIK